MNTITGVAAGMPGSGYRSNARPEVIGLLPGLRQGSKVLEVGCGEGTFAAAIPGAEEIWGIEPDHRSAEIATQRLNNVLVGTFDEVKASLPLRYFDLVVCNDVIEHMPDHDAFLRSIQDHMMPGGHLVGSVPNVRFRGNLFNLIVARDWHYQDSGILDRTHFRFFTFRSLRRSLEDAGLEVQRLQGLNSPRVPGWHFRSLVERLFRLALILLSGPAGRDIDYLQLGFVAIPVRR
jgi:2-polyprenyl-3-methyl-5-hydroxy-6-metoxy-1,4-benzoquinol methylase